MNAVLFWLFMGAFVYVPLLAMGALWTWAGVLAVRAGLEARMAHTEAGDPSAWDRSHSPEL
jgi:hypothetical protein